jgi:hypothetical protein
MANLFAQKINSVLIFEQPPDYFLHILLQLIERFRLTVSDGEAGYIANLEFSIRAFLNNVSKDIHNLSSEQENSCIARRLLHRAQLFGDEGRDVVRLDLAVGERLVEHEVRERKTAQGRVVVVARVNADGAV